MTGIRSVVPFSSDEHLPVRNVTRGRYPHLADRCHAHTEGDVAFDLEPAAAGSDGARQETAARSRTAACKSPCPA